MESISDNKHESDHAGPVADSEPQELSLAERVQQQRDLARALSGYVGLWVKVVGDEVIDSAPTLDGILKNPDIAADRIFRVRDGKKPLRLDLRKAA